MSLLSIFGCGRAKAPEYPADRLTARDGTEFTITFFKHASLSIAVGGKYIYIDPVSANADYGALPKADVVLSRNCSPPTPRSSATEPRPRLSR